MGTQRLPGSYIVTLAADGTQDAIRKAYADLGVESIKALGENRFAVRLATDPGPEEITRRAQSERAIKAVQPNYIYRQFGAPAK